MTTASWPSSISIKAPSTLEKKEEEESSPPQTQRGGEKKQYLEASSIRHASVGEKLPRSPSTSLEPFPSTKSSSANHPLESIQKSDALPFFKGSSKKTRSGSETRTATLLDCPASQNDLGPHLSSSLKARPNPKLKRFVEPSHNRPAFPWA
ncbi:unnamed protein product, partial [Vitis vinifera]